MITITISPQTAEQVQILATAMISLLQTPAAEVATITAQAVLPPEQPAKKPKAQKAAPAPAIEAPAETEAPPAAPTLEEVRAKLVAYKEKGKSLKDLFETVGCANLSAVPAERYSELLANMAKS
jgi:cell pole-organizing protein PopZ|tara:strand:- start:520 stop:891 length:372 start_codon:yes stop_codon:yes gene_type:complete